MSTATKPCLSQISIQNHSHPRLLPLHPQHRHHRRHPHPPSLISSKKEEQRSSRRCIHLAPSLPLHQVIQSHNKITIKRESRRQSQKRRVAALDRLCQRFSRRERMLRLFSQPVTKRSRYRATHKASTARFVKEYLHSSIFVSFPLSPQRPPVSSERFEITSSNHRLL